MTLLEELQQAPEAGAAPVFEGVFDEEVAARTGCHADDVGHQIGFRMGVTIRDGTFATLLVVDDEADRDPSPAGPPDCGKPTSITDEVARGIVIHEATALPSRSETCSYEECSEPG